MTTISNFYGSNNVYPVRYNTPYTGDVDFYENTKTENKEDQPKLLMDQKMLGAARLPKPSTIKRFWSKLEAKLEQWLERYNSKPHKYDADKWEDTADMINDLTDSGSDKNQKPAAVEIRA